MIPQLSPGNWSAAAQLGVAGAGDRLWGGFAPGAEVPFEITYFVPEGQVPEAPEIVVPKRRPGGGLGAVVDIDYAADYAVLSSVDELGREPGEIRDGEDTIPGQFVTYGFTVSYPDANESPEIDRLPVDITAPRGQQFVRSSLTQTRLERRGRVASYNNITPGVLGFTFNNYRRVFSEAESITTGRSLFASWVTNSFIIAIVKVLTTLLFASMAGYALARLYFPGRNLIFVLILFAQMIPGQVIFISNYLVLRDGIWGFSRLWGQSTLLNSLSGVIISGLVSAGAVFIMKQFFESIPREIEEGRDD